MELDYKELNLKIGLEIHRQMETHKLFCHCPSILNEGIPNLKIKRYLQPVASELEEEDLVAKFELEKERYCIYEYFNEKIWRCFKFETSRQGGVRGFCSNLSRVKER